MQNVVGFSNSFFQDTVQARYAARDHSCGGLGLNPFRAADASAQDGNLMSEFSHRADHAADMNGSSRLCRQIDARIKT